MKKDGRKRLLPSASCILTELLLFLSCILLASGCRSEQTLQTATPKTPVHPAVPVITKTNELSMEVTTSARTNGCKLVLRRYTNKRPSMQGYWRQRAYVNDQWLFQIEHSTSPKEQSLIFNDPLKDTSVTPIDRNLNGKYDLFLVFSLKPLKLLDVLVLTDEGWLRHGTQEEFEARQKIIENNRRAYEEGKKLFRDAFRNSGYNAQAILDQLKQP